MFGAYKASGSVFLRIHVLGDSPRCVNLGETVSVDPVAFEEVMQAFPCASIVRIGEVPRKLDAFKRSKNLRS